MTGLVRFLVLERFFEFVDILFYFGWFGPLVPIGTLVVLLGNNGGELQPLDLFQVIGGRDKRSFIL